MSEKVIIYENTNQTKDYVTGEVVEEVSHSVKRVQQTPDFVMAFTQDMAYLSALSGGATKLLFGLIQVVDRNNEITLNMSRKKKIAITTGLKIGSINPLLTQLKTKKVLIQVDRGIYALNPHFFGKGQWKNISKMRMNIEYDFDSLKKTIVFENEFREESEEDEMLEIVNAH